VVLGLEALLRWDHPQHGLIAPMQFLPLIENTGLSSRVGDWVLSQAVRQAALWHERGTPVPIAINVSALQFQQGQFVDRPAQRCDARRHLRRGERLASAFSTTP
jgi:EAL domain-containing protein (putative c-di-GMP-specific phosphodiesterase class I)